MVRFRFKALFEAIHAMSQRENLSIPMLYGLSMNFETMEPQYKSTIKGLGPWFEHEKRVQALQEKYNGDQASLDIAIEELKEENKKIIDDIDEFMKKDVKIKPYRIHYEDFPEGTFKMKTDMDFWLPILKDIK